MTPNNDLCICGVSNCGGHRCFTDGDGRLVIELSAGQLARIDADGHFWYGLYNECHRAKKVSKNAAYDFWGGFAAWRSILDGVFRSLL